MPSTIESAVAVLTEPRSIAEGAAVLTVNRVGFLGGVERVIVSCNAGVLQRGFRPVLACPADGDLFHAAEAAGLEAVGIGIDRTKATLSPARLLRQWTAFRQGSADILALAQRIKPAVIHVHHPVGGLYAAAACAALDIPLLLHVHEVLPLRPMYYLAAKRVLPNCAGIVCVSGASAALMRRLGVADDRVQVIHNGVNPSFLKHIDPAEELAQSGPHLAARRYNVGIFGVIEPRKGQDHFIESAIRLKDSHPDTHFWIVGGLSFAEHAGYQARLRQRAAEAGMADRIHFVGHRTDVGRWMAGMDVVALASVEFESLPTVLIESAVLDRAIVATDVGSVREIINDNVTGIVVKPGDAEAMSKGIARLLSSEGAGFGQRAGDDVRRRFAPERFIDQMVGVYNALMTQRPVMRKAA